jgi:hypothetical protein
VSRRYLAALAVAACLVLGIGLFVRQRLLRADTPAAAAPPSEASTLQQLSRGAQLQRMSEFLTERAAAAATLVEYRPDLEATGVRWTSDLIVSTRPDQLVVAVRAPADTARSAATIASDSIRRGWLLVVGRGADGRVISTSALEGGRMATQCGERNVEEYVLGVTLPAALAGAGLFDLDGRVLGIVVRCADRLAAIPAREVARLLADTASTRHRARDAYGVSVQPLDERARAHFGSDSGLLVTEVRRGRGAALADLRPGDLILAIDGRPATDGADLGRLVDGASADSHVVTRRRDRATAEVRLAPPTAAAAPDRADPATTLGIGVAPAAPRGVEVTAVRPGSAAAAAGMRPGDRLLRVGPTTVTSPAVAERLLAAAADRPTFIVFERDSVERGILVP